MDFPLNLSFHATEIYNNTFPENVFNTFANLQPAFTTTAANNTELKTTTKEVVVLVVFHLWLICFFLAVYTVIKIRLAQVRNTDRLIRLRSSSQLMS